MSTPIFRLSGEYFGFIGNGKVNVECAGEIRGDLVQKSPVL